MTKLVLIKIGNSVLREKTGEIDPEKIKEPGFQKFLDAMVQAMHQSEGVGLAANQVGHGVQAIVLECKANQRYPGRPDVALEIYINPKILKYSVEEEEDWEGCLSIPGYRGKVPRAKEILFEGLNREGERVEKTVTGFHARILQHEVDHINGLFYVDRMKDLKTWMHLDEFNNNKGPLEPVRPVRDKNG